MKKNNLIRILSATLSLLMLVCCIGTNFSPAKYKGTFDGVDIGVTVNATEEPTNAPVLAQRQTWYTNGGTVPKDNQSNIYIIDIVDSYTKSDSLTYAAEWDASANKDGSIMCYMYEAYDENGNRIEVGDSSSKNPAYNLVIAGNGSGRIATNVDASYTFQNFKYVIEINGLNILDTSQSTNLNSFFNHCQKVTELDLLEFNTSKATNMSSIFAVCYALKYIYIDESFDTSNVTDIGHAFFYCGSLREVDVSHWNTSKVTNMMGVFNGCSKLAVIDVSNWNTSNVTRQAEDSANYSSGGLFRGCSSVTELDLSNWDTSKINNFMDMFYGCSKLTKLDLRSFDTSKAIGMYRMFYGCTNLKTIYASTKFVTTSVTGNVPDSSPAKPRSSEMFLGCTSLVGGCGTLFDSNYTDTTYAKIDGLNGQKGYLTLVGDYTVYYHSFDENGQDYIWDFEENVSNATPYTLKAPPEKPGLTFLGWSPQGVWVSDEDSMWKGNLDYENSGTYAKSKSIRSLRGAGEAVDILDFAAYSTNKEIHLYDLYEEYQFITKKHPCINKADSSYTISEEELLKKNYYNFHLRVLLPGTTEETDTTDGARVLFRRYYYWVDRENPVSGITYPEFYFADKSGVHYVHPGMVVHLELNQVHNAESNSTSSTEYEINYYTSISLNGVVQEATVLDWCADTFTETVTYDILLSRTEKRTTISSGGCFATGTLITMADGSQLPIEEVRQGDMVRVYDHENGCYTESAVLFTEYDGDAEWHVANLEFSDGTTQEFIYDHGLFDLDLNKYVYITPDNCEEFIGHRFAKERGSGYKTVTLEKAWAEVEYTGCYSMTTTYHMNYFVNGMFSMPGGIPGLFNFFEYDEGLKYDSDLMERDIERYGLFTYEDFADYMPEAVFEQIFPIKYLKVSIGKGLTTFEELEEIIERYIYGHDLLDVFEEFPEEELEETEDLEENTEENGETETKDESTDEEKSTLNFEVENLTFDFTDDEIVTDEDVVITFTAGEGYELPETIIITIDGEEYIIYTSEEDSDKNPEGITFDTETGTLTISKELLEDAEAITIAAEGVKKEDEESEDKEENTDTDKKDESEDKDNTGKENESESGDATDKKPEGGTDTPDAEDKTESESGTNDSNGANTGTTTPETNPDNTTDDNGKDVIKGEDEDTTETPEPGTEPTAPTTPGTEDNADTEQGGEKVETEGNGAGSNENGTEETIPDTEGSDDEETTIPTEPTTPAEPSEPAVSPETPKTETPSTSEPTTGGNDDDNGETGSADSSSTESSSNSGNDSPESDASSESTTSTSPSVTPSAPTTPAPATNEPNTSSASTQASSNSSNASASSTPAPNADSNSNGASQASGTTAPSGSKETSSEE